jgi:hypothetical protein
MEVAQIIEDCIGNGIKLFIETDQLRVVVKKDYIIPEATLNLIRQKKAGIIQFLKEKDIRRQLNAQLGHEAWFDEKSLTINDNNGANDCYEVMHSQAKEYLRYEIIGAFGFNLTLKMKFSWFDKAAIEKVVETVITRHESLRTTFKKVNGKQRQVIHNYPMEGFSIEYIDLAQKKNREKVFRRIYAGLSKLPFDFETGPLVNVKIVHYDAGVNWLLFTMHHVISDEVSLNILRNELETLYEAFTEQKPDPLPPPAIQYKDYAAWVKNHMDSAKGQYSREYYHRKLLTSIENEIKSGAGTKPLPSYKKQLLRELASKLKRKNVQEMGERMYGYIVNIYTKPGACYINYFKGSPLTSLKAIAAGNKVTVFSVLVAALSIAMYRVRKEQFLRMYLPFSTRVFEKLDDVIGWFVGEVIVCIDVNEQSSLSDLITAVERNILESADHRLYPHERLMKELDVTLDVLSPIQINYIRQQGSVKDFTPRQSPAKCHFNFRCAINDYENGIEFLIDYKLSEYTAGEVENIYAEILKIIDESG